VLLHAPPRTSSFILPLPPLSLLFFFNDPPPTDIYPLSLHDALPIFRPAFTSAPPWYAIRPSPTPSARRAGHRPPRRRADGVGLRSEEHTSELQSLTNLVCRLLLEKKNNHNTPNDSTYPHSDTTAIHH